MCSNAGGQRVLASDSDFLSRDGRLCIGSTASTGFSDVFSSGLIRWLPGLDQAGLAELQALMIAYQLRHSIDPVERFGLTRAEARVAQLLVAGLSPKAIALLQGRSLNTIRTHIARMMMKTSTNRQFDLITVLTRTGGEYIL